MNTEIQLNHIQNEIVSHVHGPLLVVASAGSGKTRVLTERIKKLVPQSKRKILAITFTNKAGEELKERLAGLGSTNEKVFIWTFHSFCRRVLESHGRAIGLDSMPHIFEDISDRLELAELAINDTPEYFQTFASLSSKDKLKFLYNVLDKISSFKRRYCFQRF